MTSYLRLMSPHRPLWWLVVGAAAVALLTTLATAPAAAHIALRSATPAADAVLDRTPAEIVLTFDQAAIGLGTQVIVTGPAGPVHTGSPRLVDNTVTQPLLPGAPAGRYTVDWKVTPADGHPVSGSFDFSSRAAGTGPSGGAVTPGAAPLSGPSTDSPGIWLVGGALAGLAVLLAALVLRRIQEHRPTPPDVPPTGTADPQEKAA